MNTIFIGGTLEEAKHLARQFKIEHNLVQMPKVVPMFKLHEHIRGLSTDENRIVFCGTYPENKNFERAKEEVSSKGFQVEYQ